MKGYGVAGVSSNRRRSGGTARQHHVVTIVCLTLLQAVAAQTRPSTVYLSYEHAAPVFGALGETPPSAADWPRWIASSDEVTRARVAEGDETSIVNFLLFGTSFTREPRITARQFSGSAI